MAFALVFGAFFFIFSTAACIDMQTPPRNIFSFFFFAADQKENVLTAQCKWHGAELQAQFDVNKMLR